MFVLMFEMFFCSEAAGRVVQLHDGTGSILQNEFESTDETICLPKLLHFELEF